MIVIEVRSNHNPPVPFTRARIHLVAHLWADLQSRPQKLGTSFVRGSALIAACVVIGFSRARRDVYDVYVVSTRAYSPLSTCTAAKTRRYRTRTIVFRWTAALWRSCDSRRRSGLSSGTAALFPRWPAIGRSRCSSGRPGPAGICGPCRKTKTNSINDLSSVRFFFCFFFFCRVRRAINRDSFGWVFFFYLFIFIFFS